MYTDLFLALLNRRNARGHPILSALAYAFCPMAAHWWQAGADPVPPFDPVWKSIEDLASGETLMDYLIKYEFDGFIEEIRTYIHKVEQYRILHPIQAPELMPLFDGAKLPPGRRFGSGNAINNLGGDWRNLFVYIRTWAFLSQDWRNKMQIQRNANYTLKGEKVLLNLSFTRLPVQYDVWVWKVPVGHVTETKIGLLGSNQNQNQLLFSLMKRCSPSGKHPWPNTPTLFALDRETGEASHFDQALSDKDLEKMAQALASLAKNGPYPPLNAVRQPIICKGCGYQHLCFEKNFISRHTIAAL